MRLGPVIAVVVAIGLAAPAASPAADDDPVATVASVPIPRATFDHWMEVAAISAETTVPDAPDFSACIAAREKRMPKPTAAQHRAACRREYEGLRDQVLQFLISAEWIQGEAASRGVTVSDTEITREFERTKRQSFETEAEFQRFLKTSGMTLEDLRLRVRLDRLSTKLRADATRDVPRVTESQILRYYQRNKARFAEPERRDLRLVLTKTRVRALRALAALRAGRSFAAVVEKYSIDAVTRPDHGFLPGVARGQEERAFDRAIFAARKGALTGPVRGRFGHYVFRVQRIRPARGPSLRRSRSTIRQLLRSEREQAALDAFVQQFRTTWRARTTCREGYVTTDCSNGPQTPDDGSFRAVG